MATSPTSGPGGGSYTPPTRVDSLGGSVVSIANGAGDALRWNLGTSQLLDRTDDTLPTVLASGIYAVSTEVQCTSSMTAGGFFYCQLDFDFTGTDDFLSAESPAAVAAELKPRLTMAGTYYLAAGMTLRLWVFNADGVTARNFAPITILVQRVT